MMLETAKNLAKETDQRIEVWERGRKPLHIKREFARSCEAKASKLRFMSLFNERQFNFVNGEADSFMVNCGEQAIITLQRSDRSIRDDFGFLKQLNAQRNIRFVWNPKGGNIPFMADIPRSTAAMLWSISTKSLHRNKIFAVSLNLRGCATTMLVTTAERAELRGHTDAGPM